MFRKYLIPVAIASILISYIGIIYIDFHPKEYQVEVMFSNGTVDTLTIESSTKPFLKIGIDLMNKWGFDFSTIGFVWYKEKINPGSYTLSECEVCLIGKKGKIPTPRGARNIKQFLAEKRTRHSAKPNEIRNRIFQMFPTQNKIELFAREKHEGWDVWGNEVESSVAL